MSAAGETVTIMVKADAAWTVKTDGQSWYSLSVNGGYTGETAMKITTSKKSDGAGTYGGVIFCYWH